METRAFTPKRSRTQGGRANWTGRRFENVIDALLSETFCYVEPGHYMRALDVPNTAPIYTRQIQLPDSRNIYGEQLTHDFVLYHPEKEPSDLIIEAKWQQSSGSVDEKYPYLLLNIEQGHPFQTIIVLDGRGYKAAAAKWLRQQVARVKNLYGVYDTSEFIAWANKEWR